MTNFQAVYDIHKRQATVRIAQYELQRTRTASERGRWLRVIVFNINKIKELEQAIIT